jgi:chromate transporter
MEDENSLVLNLVELIMPVSTIFLVFSRLALSGFGGVMPFAYRALVERHQWLTAEEFARYLAASQMLPGPTICNISLMVGHRYAGVRGALAALAGVIAGPFVVVIALGVAYQRFGDLEPLRHAIRGMAAVAAGLILATAGKMAKSMFAKADWRAPRRHVLAVPRAVQQATLMALAFIGLGLLQWPLALVFCVLAPLGAAVFYLTGENK